MLTGLAAVGQDFGILATGLFKSVGQDGKMFEGTVLVDGLGKNNDTCRQAMRIKSNRPESERTNEATEEPGFFVVHAQDILTIPSRPCCHPGGVIYYIKRTKPGIISVIFPIPAIKTVAR